MICIAFQKWAPRACEQCALIGIQIICIPIVYAYTVHDPRGSIKQHSLTGLPLHCYLFRRQGSDKQARFSLVMEEGIHGLVDQKQSIFQLRSKARLHIIKLHRRDGNICFWSQYGIINPTFFGHIKHKVSTIFVLWHFLSG